MDYKIAICDDNISDIAYVNNFIKDWVQKNQALVRVDTFSSSESFWFHCEDENDYDILLLDIEMGEMNGVELAKAVRKKNKTVQIIFITGYTEYILDGYEVEALHYLLKPVNGEKVQEVLNRAVEKLQQKRKMLVLQKTGETFRIPLYEIDYLEVQKNYVTIHGKEDVSVKSTLGELEKELDEFFFRVGRSYIVNLTAIRKITKKDVFLRNGDVIPLPRNMYEALNRAVIQYM